MAGAVALDVPSRASLAVARQLRSAEGTVSRPAAPLIGSRFAEPQPDRWPDEPTQQGRGDDDHDQSLHD
jgi:hypothetical protein